MHEMESPFMSLEPLESRRLMSITVDSNHILQIKGTEAADNITLTDSSGQVQVVVNSDPPQTFNPATLSGYFIQGLGGNDGIVIWNTIDGATVYGGEVDQVFGGSGTDTGIVDGIDQRGAIENQAII